MNIDKFIEDNEDILIDMCLSAANKMLPYKKSIGYSQRKNVYDEADFIFNDLFKPCAYKANMDKDGFQWLESGFYRVIVSIDDDCIDVYIDFTLEEKTFERR
jgi:mRNA-degrading endonuclease RelE of RelBE toxin-antitoxin system